MGYKDFNTEDLQATIISPYATKKAKKDADEELRGRKANIFRRG